MSWIRTAVNRAVEVGGRSSNITRAVLYAGNAVSEGARLLHDRIGPRNMQNFRLAAKRLEEVSVSCRGIDRVQLLRRWLIALTEIERLSSSPAASPRTDDHDKIIDQRIVVLDQSKDSPRKPTMVYYVDPDLGTMNFRDVFLYSQALEGITLSMILEAPNEEEVSLMLKIFGLCLTGGTEVHLTVMNNIQNLATAFISYEEEVLIKREELLQHAQFAITGLKINADIARIDAEACRLIEKLDKVKDPLGSSNGNGENSSEDMAVATTEDLKETLGKIQLCSTLESLLLKKKSLSSGDSPEVHAQKIDKLKVLSESLLNSTSKAEKRIGDHRYQKEEALNFRVAKASEVRQLEKELVTEILELEKKKNELEDELNKVNASLALARSRLHNAKEEREQFDDASNEILMHLKAKEDELSRSMNSCKTEADVVNMWIGFLEDSWILQMKLNERNENQVNGQLERYGEYFVNLVVHLLHSYKEQLGSSTKRIRGLAEHLHAYKREVATPIMEDEVSKATKRQNLEEEYLDIEANVSSTIKIVDGVKRQFYAKHEGIYRKDGEKITQLFDAIGKIKQDFESIERPALEIETQRKPPLSLATVISQDIQSFPSKQTFTNLENNEDAEKDLVLASIEKAPDSQVKPEKLEKETQARKGGSRNVSLLDARDEMENKIKLELDLDGAGDSTEEIGEWEFDQLEKDHKSSS